MKSSRLVVRLPPPLRIYRRAMRELQSLLDRAPTLPAPVSSFINESCFFPFKFLEHAFYIRNSIISKALHIKTLPTIDDKRPGHLVWNEWRRILHLTSILLMQVLKRTVVATYTADIQYLENNLRKQADYTENKDIIT